MQRTGSRQSAEKLYAIAASQHGFFTAAEARAAGYRDNVHPYHVKNGDWIRLARGIYRLARFPETVRPELMVALLWTRNRRGETEGALSHLTALEVRGMVAAHPDAVHVTVPCSFRRNSRPPGGVILHKGQANSLSAEDIESIGGLRVTGLIKTVADLESNGYARDFFEEVGIEQALEGNGRPRPASVGSLSASLAQSVRPVRRPRPRRKPGVAEKSEWDEEAPRPRPTPPRRPDDSWGGARTW